MKELIWTIYCHTHIDSGRRYIGLTKKTMMQRWNLHLANAKNKYGKGCHHFWNAIRKYGKDAFEHKILAICYTLEEANAAEIEEIAKYDTTNPEKGFNLKRGGDHMPHPIRKNPWNDPEFRSKNLPRFVAAGQSSQARAASKATLNTPESKAKRSAIIKEIMNSPEMIAKRRIFQDDPAYKAMISETTKIARSKPEIKEKTSESIKANWTNHEYRKKVIAGNKIASLKPEVREKRSNNSKLMWEDPEYRAKMAEISREVKARPEVKAKMSAIMTGKTHTPESIEKQRQLFLQRSSECKFCDKSIEGKRTAINGRVSCFKCYGLHKNKFASFLRPDKSFLIK